MNCYCHTPNTCSSLRWEICICMMVIIIRRTRQADIRRRERTRTRRTRDRTLPGLVLLQRSSAKSREAIEVLKLSERKDSSRILSENMNEPRCYHDFSHNQSVRLRIRQLRSTSAIYPLYFEFFYSSYIVCSSTRIKRDNRTVEPATE